MNYDSALELFKTRNYATIIGLTEEFMTDRWDLLTSEPPLTKLIDIAFRAALMVGDQSAIGRLADRCRCIGALSHYPAAVYFETGEDDLAWASLADASFYEPRYHGFWSLGLNSIARNARWHDLYVASLSSRRVRDRPVELIGSGQLGGKRWAVTFSADAGYFKRFFRYSLGSLRSTCRDYLATYHIVGPDEECLELIRTFDDDDVVFRVERPTAGWRDRSYFASARMFAAERCLSETSLPTFILDIDMVVTDDLGRLITSENWDPERLALRLQPGVQLPWHRVTANSIYLPANDRSRRYLGLVCDFMEYAAARYEPANLWWIDQNALFFAMLMTDAADYQAWKSQLRDLYLSSPKMMENKDAFFETRLAK